MKNQQVTIVIAFHNPNVNWLEIQLNSINNQTYTYIDVIAVDDCSTKISFDELQSIFPQCLSKTSYNLIPHNTNLGSNATFAYLTELAQGQYFAYCDQDDYY